MSLRVFRPLLVCGLVAALLAATDRPASAQSALERLERQLDRVLGPLTGDPDQDQNRSDADAPLPPPTQDSDTLPAPRNPAALRELERRLADGSLRPYLGVTVVDLTNANRGALDVPVRAGALVEAVVDGSPAAEAEVEAGVVVVAIDGRRVDRGADLVDHLQRRQPGDEVVLLYYRGPRLQRTRITLAAIEADQLNDLTPQAPPLASAPSNLGGEGPVPPPAVTDPTPAPANSGGRRLELFDRTDGRIIPRLGNRSEPARSQDELLQIIEQQQRAIEDLQRRVADLERRVNGG